MVGNPRGLNELYSHQSGIKLQQDDKALLLWLLGTNEFEHLRTYRNSVYHIHHIITYLYQPSYNIQRIHMFIQFFAQIFMDDLAD